MLLSIGGWRKIFAFLSVCGLISLALASIGTVLATIAWPTFIIGIMMLTGATALVMTALYFWGVRSQA